MLHWVSPVKQSSLTRAALTHISAHTLVRVERDPAQQRNIRTHIITDALLDIHVHSHVTYTL